MRVRWELLQEPKSQFTVSESFTLGWLNVLLRHLWPTIIEKEAAEIAAKNIKACPPCCLVLRWCGDIVHAQMRNLFISEAVAMELWNSHVTRREAYSTRHH